MTTATQYAKAVRRELSKLGNTDIVHCTVQNMRETLAHGYVNANASILTEGIYFPCGCGCGDLMDAADALLYINEANIPGSEEWVVAAYSGWLLYIYHRRHGAMRVQQ